MSANKLQLTLPPNTIHVRVGLPNAISQVRTAGAFHSPIAAKSVILPSFPFRSRSVLRYVRWLFLSLIRFPTIKFREDGVILDFAGPNYVCVDHFSFGSATRYLQLDKEKIFCIIRNTDPSNEDSNPGAVSSWDDTLKLSTQEFQHRDYNILTCNCHSFVANNLNRMRFQGGRWNVVSLALLILFKGRWVSRGSALRSLLPFFVVLAIGLAIGGLSFLKYLAIFCFILCGWFLIGSYCFKNLIQL